MTDVESSPTGDTSVVTETSTDDATVSTRAIAAPVLPENCSISTVRGGELWEEAAAYEYDCFTAFGWCEQNDRRRLAEYEAWDDESVFHVARVAGTDASGGIVGVMRTIIGPYEELPVALIGHTDEVPVPDPVCEVASLVVDPSFERAREVAEYLMRAGYTEARANGAHGLAEAVEAWLLEMFRDGFGLVTVTLGGPTWHMGGDLYPMVMPLVESEAKLIENRPTWYKWLTAELTPAQIAAADVPILLD